MGQKFEKNLFCKLQCNNMIAIEGDTAYFVYLNDNKKISTFFNAVEYVPADNLVIEE